MKKYPARYLSNKEKELIVKRIGKGEKVSRVCKEINVSRTTLYKWLKIKSWKQVDLSRKACSRKISAIQRRKMIKLALKYPDYSIRKISSLSGLSVGFVWSVMRRYSLDTKELRREHFLAQGTSLYKDIRGKDKIIMMDRYITGESITRICSEYGISRTIFYKWIHKCNKKDDGYAIFEKGRPSGSSHWRFIAGMEGAVRDLVARNPELSLSKLHKRIKLQHVNTISRSGLYYVCRRLDLATYEKRLTYAQSVSLTDTLRLEQSSIKGAVMLFSQLVFLSLSSLAVGFCVLVFGQSVMEYEPASKLVVNKIQPERHVYEERHGSEEIIYIVRAGDNLWHISEEIYGSGYNWVDIARINKLPNPDLIDIEQKLVIPVVTAKEVTLAIKE